MRLARDTELAQRITFSGREPHEAEQERLAEVELEAEAQMLRARRSVWFSVLLGGGMWVVLIIWAIVAPRLGGRAELVFGLAVATEAAAMGFLLAIYSHNSQVRVLEHYLNRLRDLAIQLQETSDRDSLTGLFNHGYLLRRLQEEISLAGRSGRSFTAVILDLNEFKQVNDEHGHLVGDEVLEFVAGVIHGRVREHDVVARYGGDEFCLVLPETDRAGADAVIKKLRAAIDSLSTLLETWLHCPISFECGISTYPEDGETVQTLIAQADAQLYKDKQLQRIRRARDTGDEVSGRKTAGAASAGEAPASRTA